MIKKIFFIITFFLNIPFLQAKISWFTQSLRTLVDIADPVLTDWNKKNWYAIIQALEYEGPEAKDLNQENEEEICYVGDLPDDISDLINYMNHPEQLLSFGISLPKGILLVGPPGTGKTSLVREIARQTKSGFFNESASHFIELYVGMGALRIRELFDKAKKYVEQNPLQMAIIFIDDIDAIAARRELSNDERRQAVNELLEQMDGFVQTNNIIVIAATNDAKIIDEAVKRSGRFDKIIEVPLPSEKNRLQLLLHYAQKHGIHTKDSAIPFKKYSILTHGFCCADIKTMVNSAAQFAMRDKSDQITEQHFEKALQELIAKKKW